MARGTTILGIVVTPMPVVLGLLAAMWAVGEAMDTTFILFAALFLFAMTWMLILVSKILLYILPWKNLRAHLTVMYVVTFTALWFFVGSVEYVPDTTVAYHVNDQQGQTFNFALGGTLAQAIVAALGALCMRIYWHHFKRIRVESVDGDQPH